MAALYTDLAERVLRGERLPRADYLAMAACPAGQVPDLMAGAARLREHYFGRDVHVCMIANIKSGRCSEDCAFCAQSGHARAEIPVYPLQGADEVQAAARAAAARPIHRYGLVASGRRLPAAEVARVADAVAGLPRHRVGWCASLGSLESADLARLRVAGLTRYHHNLETAAGFYPHICTTHTWAERVATLRAARGAGLALCAGGLFGLGESDEQRLELAEALRDLEVDAVPINFLAPIPGTRLAGAPRLTPWDCLKIIALFRFVLPDKDILVCGGRLANLQDLHPRIFDAGASGLMTGDYLTTTGRSMQDDLDMIAHLGLRLRPVAAAGQGGAHA